MSAAIAALHSAPHVVPIVSPPLREGAVVVAQDGTIAAVGPRAELRAAWPQLVERRWEGTLLPGLVNAHTHLQYSDLAELGARPHDGFEAWCAAFDARYPQAGGDGWGDAARRGLELSLRAGVTCIGDVVTDDDARDVLRDAGVAGVAYLETLGDDDAGWAAGGRDRYLARLDAAGATAAASGGAASGAASGPARFGVSPHAPYSVDGGVLGDLGRIARDCGLRLHVHLAESRLEHELVLAGSGRLAQLVREWGWSLALLDDPAGVSPARFLDERLALGPDCHVAHGVALDADDRALLRERGCAVALCLRSNQTIGVEAPPLAAYLEERSPICVGTDSLASAPSLDLLGELPPLRALAREQGYRDDDLDARLVHAATAGGAAALGLAGRAGALRPGARADLAHLAVRPLPGESIERAVVARGAGACTATLVAGVVVR